MGVEGDGGKEGREGWGEEGRGGMKGKGWSKGGGGGRKGKECGKRRAGEEGKRTRAAGGREGLPSEEGGAGITGPSQPGAPGQAGREASAEAGALRAGTAPGFSRAAVAAACGEDPDSTYSLRPPL